MIRMDFSLALIFMNTNASNKFSSDKILFYLLSSLFLDWERFGFLDGVTGFQYAILSAYHTFRKYWLYLKTEKHE